MHSNRLAVVALVAAVLGGAAVLLVAKAAGWVGAGGTKTVFVPIGERDDAPARPAVVRVARPLAAGSFDPTTIYASRSAGVVTIHALGAGSAIGHGAAQGSGFVVSRDGYILTNAHVITSAPDTPVKPAPRVFVEFEDRDRVPARIVGWDLFTDVGVLKVDPQAHVLTPVPLGDSSRVVVGEPVAAIGSPFGNQNTLTVGIVSAVRRSIRSLTSQYRVVDAIQTDAAITHGNSGGPLLDSRGRAIGINAQIRSTSGANQGVGFAIPINSAERAMAELIASGRVRYAYVGVATDDLTPTVARRFGYGVRYGAVVACVKEDRPADDAGFQDGEATTWFNGREFARGADVIVAVNGEPVRRGDDVVRIVSERLRPGQVARFRLLRGTERRTVSVRLDERPLEPTSGC